MVQREKISEPRCHSYILTIDLNAAVSIAQRVPGHTFIRAVIRWTDGVYRQPHVYFVRVIFQHWIVFSSCKQIVIPVSNTLCSFICRVFFFIFHYR